MLQFALHQTQTDVDLRNAERMVTSLRKSLAKIEQENTELRKALLNIKNQARGALANE